MRKISVLIASVMLALAISLSSLFGCGLITTNNERDMNQVIATVQIEESAPKEIIYKKDLFVAYLNYYYQSQSEMTSDVFSSLVDYLINNKVIVQYAMQYYASSDEYSSIVNSENKWKVETYLDDQEKRDAIYQSYKDMNDLIDSYVTDKEEEKLGDTYSETIRVIPTGAKNNEEKSDSQKQAYIDKGIDVVERRNAFVELINVLKVNDLLGDNYKNGNILSTEYYSDLLEDYQQSALIEKFKKDVNAKARKVFSYQDVVEEYAKLYQEQKAYSKTEFESALSSISESAPILYGREGYGMVYHILLKADDDMSQKLEDIKSNYSKDNGTPAYENEQYRKDRAELFKSITGTDLRYTWINAGYDFGGDATTLISGYESYNKVFTGDYTLNKDASLPFFGSVTHINNVDKDKDDYRSKYSVQDVREFSLDEVIFIVNDYLYNGTAQKAQSDASTYKATTVNGDFDKRVKELIFAFSQDDGETALNTYKGYAIKPTPDSDEEEEWMLEFAEEGRKLIKTGEDTFKVVATDYGYHIMFYSENFGGYNYPTLEEYLDAEYGQKDWAQEYENMLANWDDYEETNNYLYVLQNSLSSEYVNQQYSALEQKLFADYVYNNNVVVRFEDAYRDLLSD